MAAEQDEKKLIIPPEKIQQRVLELGRQISRDLDGHDVLALGVLKGAFVFLGDLVRHLAMPVEVDFIRLASYGHSDASSGQINLIKPPEASLAGRTVLVVEDIIDTGLTLDWLKGHLARQGVRDIRLCTLIDKPERRRCQLSVDYVGFHVPRGFLVGYGLDYNECYRCLPGVYELLKP